MSRYSTVQYITGVIRLLALAVILDYFLGPKLGIDTSFITWIVGLLTAEILLISAGWAFGMGTTKGTLVETEDYGRQVAMRPTPDA